MNRVRQARHLRNRMTDAERALWRGLKERQIEGCKFRRQCPIGPYIVDFVCLDRMLVVEVDGGQHAVNEENDELRTAWLKKIGYTVLRFWNNEVLQQREAVLEAIRSALIDLASGQARHLRKFGEAKVSETNFAHPHPSGHAVELTGASVIASLPQRGRTGGGESNTVAEVHFDHPHPNLPPSGEGAEKPASGLLTGTGRSRDEQGDRDSTPRGDH